MMPQMNDTHRRRVRTESQKELISSLRLSLHTVESPRLDPAQVEARSCIKRIHSASMQDETHIIIQTRPYMTRADDEHWRAPWQ